MFDKSFGRVFGHEGRYQRLYSDRGNWTSGRVGVGKLKGTKFGISAMSYPELDIKNLTMEQAREIYHRDWWVKLRMDKFLPAVSYQMFDAAINHGMYNATRMIQRAVGVKDDGIIGPVTFGKVVAYDLNDLLFRFLAERIEFMTHIRTWNDYGKGWSRRIAGNLRYAATDN